LDGVVHGACCAIMQRGWEKVCQCIVFSVISALPVLCILYETIQENVMGLREVRVWIWPALVVVDCASIAK